MEKLINDELVLVMVLKYANVALIIKLIIKIKGKKKGRRQKRKLCWWWWE